MELQDIAVWTAILLAGGALAFLAFGRRGTDASGQLAGRLEQLAEQQAATTLPRLSKMASWGEINSILSAATPGAPVEVTFRPPPEIPIKAGVVYFAIPIDNNYWRNIVTDRQIAVYLPRPFEPGQTKVELLGIPRKA